MEPDQAGESLNKLINDPEKERVIQALIHQGARINQSLLFNAILFGQSLQTIQLICERGTEHTICKNKEDQRPYNHVFFAAFYPDLNVLKYVLQKFPDQWDQAMSVFESLKKRPSTIICDSMIFCVPECNKAFGRLQETIADLQKDNQLVSIAAVAPAPAGAKPIVCRR